MTLAPPEQIAVRLAQVARQVEHGFLGAGQKLEVAVDILHRLNARFADQVTELTDGTLEKAADGLADAGHQVMQLADAHDADAAALVEVDGIVAAITRRVAALQPIIQEIDALALNARVVAAGMGSAGSDFLAFTASIHAAVNRARASLLHVGDDLRRAERGLSSARHDIAAFSERQGEALRSIPRRLTANRDTLAVRRNVAETAAATAHARAEAIGRRVAEQIAALQLGDIIRQRLEHVQAGAELLAQQPQGGGIAGRILAAQMRDVAEVLSGQGVQIERRLTQLSADATAIDQLGLDVNAEAADRRDSFAAGLQADLRQTVALFAELRAADGDTEQRIRSVLDAAVDLADRLAGVEAVEQDILIIGLNATLKCGRLGAVGRPLAAVAQELRACGHRFAGEAAAVLQQLDRLRVQAGGLLDPHRAQCHAALAEAATGMLAAVETLHRLEGELQQGVTQLQADAEHVGRLVAAALEDFSFRDAAAAEMQACAQSLHVTSDGQAADPAQADALLARMAATYTMACEREIHAGFARLPKCCESAGSELSIADDVLF